MSRYKVLSLPIILDGIDRYDFDFFTDEWLKTKEKIEPIFNRYGYYLDRKKNICWAETKFGCWIMGNRADFMIELEYQTSDEFILPKEVIVAFKLLNKYNVLPVELSLKWYQHTNAVALRNTRWESRKMWLAIERKEKRRAAYGNSPTNIK